MKSQLIVFDGGLNTLKAPTLIASNQAVACMNVDLTKGSIYPYKDFISIDTPTGKHAFVYNHTILHNTDENDNRNYILFGNRLYYTNGTYSPYGLMRIKEDLSIVNAVAPSVSSFGTFTLTAVDTNGSLDGDYAYLYTVVDSDGIESVPSPIVTVTATNQNINFAFDDTSPNDGTPDGESVSETIYKRRVYRTGGANPTFNLIAELDASTLSFKDIIKDIDVPRIELSTFEDYAPPSDLTNLVENGGTFWASVENRIYFSKSGQPEYWHPLDFITINDTCIGLGVFRDMVIAFTSTDAYAINGWNRDNVTLTKLPFNEGCQNNHSIVYTGSLLVWASYNGICIFNGSDIEVITRDLLEWSDGGVVGEDIFDSSISTFDAESGFKIDYATYYKGKYYCTVSNSLLIIDLKHRGIVSNITINNPVSVYYNKDENNISVIKRLEDDSLEELTFNINKKNMLAIWKTGEIQDNGNSSVKMYRKVFIDTNTPTYVRVFIDSNQVLYVANRKAFHLPPGSIGNTIQFEIGTKEEIRSLKYEYEVLS